MMTRSHYMLFLAMMFAMLVLTATVVNAGGADYVRIPRAAAGNIVLTICLGAFFSLAFARCEASGFRLYWMVPVFFWIAAAYPIFRELSGLSTTSSFADPLSNASAPFLMLFAFLMFLGLRDVNRAERRPIIIRRLQWTAGAIAGFSIAVQPLLVLKGIMQLPLIGHVLPFEAQLMNQAVWMQNKLDNDAGLVPGLGREGNALMVLSFVCLLLVIWGLERFFEPELYRVKPEPKSETTPEPEAVQFSGFNG